MRGAQIETDGITVWVNSNTGHCIGRFGRMGIDIHRSLKDQLDLSACLHCTHSEVTEADWETFKAEMLRHHNVNVTDRYKPKRFQPSQRSN